RVLQRVREIADHLLVAHVLALEQRADVVHADAREILALHRFQVGAAALDAKHGDVVAAVIALDGLDRGVAAAPDDQRGLGADEARGVYEEVEALERRGLGVIPARLHRALTISQARRSQAWREDRVRRENTCRSPDDALNKNRPGEEQR